MLLDQHRTEPMLLAERRERRRQVRQVALLRVALLHAGGTSDICVVRNVSPNGLSARVYRKLAAGDPVEIEFRSGELLAGSVIWESDYDVGLAFPQPIDVAALLANRRPARTGKRRSLPRIDVDCRGRLCTGLRTIDVLLHDISQGGASIEVQTGLTRLGNVRLSLPDLPEIAGVVRWTSGTKLGLSFDQCLPCEQLARWIQARREGLGQREPAPAGPGPLATGAG